MSILIILSFILIFASCIILLMPKKVALRIAGINTYDLETVPTKTVVIVYVVSMVVLVIATGLLMFILKDHSSPLPTFMENIIEWLTT